MELITINNKTEYITSFNSAMELVENKCGLELARCIQDMHQQALEEQEKIIHIRIQMTTCTNKLNTLKIKCVI